MKNNNLFLLLCTLCAAGALGCTPPPATFHFTGDIMLSRDVEPILKEKGFQWPYEAFQERFLKDDLTLSNLECPITTAKFPVLKNKIILFKALPESAKALKTGGYDLLNLANNHSMDYNEEGLKQTLDLLHKEDLLTLGAQKGAAKAKEPYYYEKRGIRYGFMGYSAFPPEGYIHDPEGFDTARTDENLLSEEIQTAKNKCDVLIVSVHWGKEFESRPSEMQKKIARQIIDAGADLIIGHHPHVIQSVEKYQDKYIFYSLGNFIFDRQKPPGTDEALVLETTFTNGKLNPPVLIPVVIKNARPEPASSEKAQAIMDGLKKYSENMGTELIKVDDGWEVR